MGTKEEMKNADAVFEELIENYDFLKEREQSRICVRTRANYYHSRCPRCNARSKISSGHPYCPNCNWDSLEDPSYYKAA